MKTETRHVDDAQLQSLLWDDENSLDFRVAAEHVETCEFCRRRLEEHSGSQAIDDDARDLLSGQDWRHLSSARGRDATDPAFHSELDFLVPASHPELLGRIGRYEVERAVGQGGMGIVLKAHDTDLNRPVAIKVLAKHLAHRGAARQRFARESKAAAAVVHEHVVAIHNVEAEGNVPFLVMQFIAGQSLQSRVDESGPLDVKEILRIGIQATAGLAAAHEQGVIHRDVKPANIMLESGVERVLLTDFGLARMTDDASLTHTGVISGTPQYMSPEQANGQPVDQRTDLFSLGAVLYFMATGHSPFRADRAMGVLNRICHHRQKPLWQINAEIPDELSSLVDRLLEKQPTKRFASARATRDHMVRLLAQIQHPRPSAWRTLRRAIRRNPKRHAVLSFALLAVVVVPIAWMLKPDSATKSASSVDRNGIPNATTSIAPFALDGNALMEFDEVIRDLHTRLDALTEFRADHGFSAEHGMNERPREVTVSKGQDLRSLHQRLERLQGNESIESLLRESEESK